MCPSAPSATPTPRRAGPLTAAALAALLLLLSACDSGPAEPPPEPTACGYVGDEPRSRPGDPSVLMPLAVGNCWSYVLKNRDPYDDTLTYSISREVNLVLGGQAVRAFARQALGSWNPNPYPDQDLLANGSSGLDLVGRIAPGDTLRLRQLGFKYPGQAGESWPYVRSIYLRPHDPDYGFIIADTLTRTLVSTDAEIVTPAGTFRCYVYRYSFRPADDVADIWNMYEYYAPGLGLVAGIIKSSDGYGMPDDDEPVEQLLLMEYRLLAH